MTAKELKMALKYIFIDNSEQDLRRQYLLEKNNDKEVYKEGVVRGKVDNVIIHYNNGEVVDDIVKHTGISQQSVMALINNMEIAKCDENEIYEILTDEDRTMIDYNVKMLYEENCPSYIEWLSGKIIQHYQDINK